MFRHSFNAVLSEDWQETFLLPKWEHIIPAAVSQDVELPTSASMKLEGGSRRREGRVDESVSFYPWPVLRNQIQITAASFTINFETDFIFLDDSTLHQIKIIFGHFSAGSVREVEPTARSSLDDIAKVCFAELCGSFPPRVLCDLVIPYHN